MSLPQVLMIDDDQRFCMAMSKALRRRGFEVRVINDANLAVDAINTATSDTVAVLDLNMPKLSGLEVLHQTIKRASPVLMLTGHGAVPEAVEAMRAGAYTFLTKPIDAADLAPMLIQAFQHANESEINAVFIGESESARHIRSMIQHLSDSSETILIMGDTGTGKKVVARCLHENSARAQEPFISVNLSALTTAQIEETLFGSRGETVSSSAPPLLSQVGEGTLFLDEVCELSPLHQAKLLELIQTRLFQSEIGELTSFKGRVIVTTNRNLSDEVRSSHFREDLFYGLTTLPILIEPLNKRSDDSILIFESWLTRLTNMKPLLTLEARTLLVNYPWPGNAREVVNLARRVGVMAKVDHLAEEEILPIEARWLRSLLSNTPFSLPSHRSLSPSQQELQSSSHNNMIGEDISLEIIERAHITKLLDKYDNLSQVARILQVNRRTLQRKLKQWEGTE